MATDLLPRTARRVGLAVAITVLGVSACTSDDESSTSAESTSASITVEPQPDTTSAAISAAAPVPIVDVYESVAFYPACGSETLDHLGVTWYQLVHPGYEPAYPQLQERFDEVIAVERAESPVAGLQGFVHVSPPGPGDDIGTLVIWADGVARWVSDNGQLDVWMTDEKVVDPWPC